MTKMVAFATVFFFRMCELKLCGHICECMACAAPKRLLHTAHISEPQHIVAGVRFHWSREERHFQCQSFRCSLYFPRGKYKLHLILYIYSMYKSLVLVRIICDQYFICRLISPLETVSSAFSHHRCAWIWRITTTLRRPEEKRGFKSKTWPEIT